MVEISHTLSHLTALLVSRQQITSVWNYALILQSHQSLLLWRNVLSLNYEHGRQANRWCHHASLLFVLQLWEAVVLVTIHSTIRYIFASPLFASPSSLKHVSYSQNTLVLCPWNAIFLLGYPSCACGEVVFARCVICISAYGEYCVHTVCEDKECEGRVVLAVPCTGLILYSFREDMYFTTYILSFTHSHHTYSSPLGLSHSERNHNRIYDGGFPSAASALWCSHNSITAILVDYFITFYYFLL